MRCLNLSKSKVCIFLKNWKRSALQIFHRIISKCVDYFDHRKSSPYLSIFTFFFLYFLDLRQDSEKPGLFVFPYAQHACKAGTSPVPDLQPHIFQHPNVTETCPTYSQLKGPCSFPMWISWLWKIVPKAGRL